MRRSLGNATWHEWHTEAYLLSYGLSFYAYQGLNSRKTFLGTAILRYPRRHEKQFGRAIGRMQITRFQICLVSRAFRNTK